MKTVIVIDQYLSKNDNRFKSLVKFTHEQNLINGGTRFYFSHIVIVDKTSIIDDYFIWSNVNGIKFLAIPMTTSLLFEQELKRCALAAIELLPCNKPILNWNDQMLYIKISDENNIPPLNKILQIAVTTYGILVSKEKKAYLQFELAEWKIVDSESLLA